jgi:hypothetical protein
LELGVTLERKGEYIVATLLGGSRWDDEMSPLDDDWYAYKLEQEAKNNPLNIDYVKESHRND